MTSGTTATSGGGAEPCKTVGTKTAVVVVREDWDRTTLPSSYADGWMGFTENDDPWSATRGATRGPCMRWGSYTNGALYVDDGRLVLVGDGHSGFWTADPLPDAPYCVVFSVDRFALPGTGYDERASSDWKDGGFDLDIQRTDPAWDCWGGELYIDVPNDNEVYNGNTTDGWYWALYGHNYDAEGYLPAAFQPDVFFVRIEWALTYSRVKIWSAEDEEPEAWTGRTPGVDQAEKARGFSLYLGEWNNPSARAVGPVVISAVTGETAPCDGGYGDGWAFSESPGSMSVVSQGGYGGSARPTFSYSYTFDGVYPWNPSILLWQYRSQQTIHFTGLVPHATYRFRRKCVVTCDGGWSYYLSEAPFPVSIHTYDPLLGVPAYAHGGFTGGDTVYEGTFSPQYGAYGCEWLYQVQTPWGLQDWYICGKSTGAAIDDDPRALTVDFEAVATGNGSIAFFVHLYQYDDWAGSPPYQGVWGCSGGSFDPGCGPARSYSVVWGAAAWTKTKVHGGSASVLTKCGTDETVPAVGSTGGGSVMTGR